MSGNAFAIGELQTDNELYFCKFLFVSYFEMSDERFFLYDLMIKFGHAGSQSLYILMYSNVWATYRFSCFVKKNYLRRTSQRIYA